MGVLQAQVMKGKPAEARMEGVHRPSASSIPVMFFGTLEIAWVSPGDLTAWREGIRARLHTKPKARKAFESSLREVWTAESIPLNQSRTLLTRHDCGLPNLDFIIEVLPEVAICRLLCGLSFSSGVQLKGSTSGEWLSGWRCAAGCRICNDKEVAAEVVVQAAPTAQSSREPQCFRAGQVCLHPHRALMACL